MMMLTRLPMGTLPAPVPEIAQARWAFPLVGVPMGLAGWAVFAVAGALGLPPLTCALAALAALAVLTGGLHHDGLADFTDGMGGHDRAHRLEIMRDSRIGSYGVIALLFAVGLSASALSVLLPSALALAGFVMIGVASRLAVLLVLDLMPPARDNGLGRMAADSRRGWPWRVWIPGGALCALTVLAMGWAALPALLVMAVAAGIIAWRAHRLLGGQTGDVLGAVQLTCETAGWVVLSAAL
jgi:adenosylcobinamide-GDP ribazoletransferase